MRSLPGFDWWITNITHWCRLYLDMRSSISAIHILKIIKARYGPFLDTHPYLHMYIHLHVLFYKSELNTLRTYFALRVKGCILLLGSRCCDAESGGPSKT